MKVICYRHFLNYIEHFVSNKVSVYLQLAMLEMVMTALFVRPVTLLLD